jgi:LPXTG-motif cell wall-anchored protein
MSEEFIVEEEESRSSLPFLLTATGLVGLLLLIVLGTVGYSILRRGQRTDQVAAIEAANATTLAQNVQVTQTIAAMETQAALPPTATNTIAPTAVPPTATPPPTVTAPKATETPVVRPPEESQTTATVNAAATSLFATALFNATPTAIAGAGGGATGGATGGGSGSTAGTGGQTGGGSGGALPQTGGSVWGVAGIALALIALLFVARRLRAG